MWIIAVWVSVFTDLSENVLCSLYLFLRPDLPHLPLSEYIYFNLAVSFFFFSFMIE